MGWRIVRQPDGKLARWSDVVDNFTHYGLTESQALALCEDVMPSWEAAEKVRAGVEDHEPWTIGVKGDGLSRWRDCMESLGYRGNIEETVATLHAMGFSDWEDHVRKVHKASRE